ncbi:hypothetical protein HCG51_32915 [Tolypothrix sp. PCC 7910]|uniref:hypothetical protein n=1 Tax=Tolypothrix sp. PCC 7910 TaxID=2099387 RepID=UPI0014277C71|nr:hypothetical protein [Tolypothrix sp. PCC 7910]QIR41013.1 hypothetical protein HCG51_32915 [Tolypothrix sp. PCC 7910]
MNYLTDRHKFLQKEKQLLHTELVKYGIDYDIAAKAAQILAEKKPDEVLTEEEIQLTKEVCEVWLQQRNRLASISKVIN